MTIQRRSFSLFLKNSYTAANTKLCLYKSNQFKKLNTPGDKVVSMLFYFVTGREINSFLDIIH